VIGEGFINELVMHKSGVDNWNNLFIYNYVIEKGFWEFTLKIIEISTDRSGLVFGFFKSDNENTSLD